MKIFRPIVSITLALLVLVSSTSFVVGIHVCMGQVQNVTLFTKAEGCGMEQNVPPCHKTTTKPCCEDETIVHKSSELKASVDQLQITPITPVDAVLPHMVMAEIIPAYDFISATYHSYDPPLRSCDLILEHHVFLI